MKRKFLDMHTSLLERCVDFRWMTQSELILWMWFGAIILIYLCQWPEVPKCNHSPAIILPWHALGGTCASSQHWSQFLICSVSSPLLNFKHFEDRSCFCLINSSILNLYHWTSWWCFWELWKVLDVGTSCCHMEEGPQRGDAFSPLLHLMPIWSPHW